MSDEQFERAIDDTRESIENPSARRSVDEDDPDMEDGAGGYAHTRIASIGVG